MANNLYIAHLEDLIEAYRTIPNFNMAEELASLAAAIAEGEAE